MVIKIMRQIVVITVQRAWILCQTHSLICTLDSMFSSVRASSTLLVHLTLSTNYLCYRLLYLLNLYMNIPKERISTLDGTCRRPHCSYAWTSHKRTCMLELKTVDANYFSFSFSSLFSFPSFSILRKLRVSVT